MIYLTWKECLRQCRVIWFYNLRYGRRDETRLYTGEFVYFFQKDRYLNARL